MRLLPLLVFVCFVLYEVLQVEGKSKQNVVKKLLQKYIHHHKHPHHHKHHHHHVHHHHKSHHHHHHHHHPHHKHWHHHHHHHHHKSFHQKLVERLKKEKQHHHQKNDVDQKATKRASLPQLLVSLGKGFMQLGKHLGNNESHADVQAKDTAMKHAPTPKPLVDDHVATTQAASAFATPSPTSEHYSENDDSDDIGGGALTSAPPTPTMSQKVTSFDSESSQSNYRGRTVPHPGNIDSPIITPTPQSEPSPSPSTKPQATSVSPSKNIDKLMKPTMDPIASRISKLKQGSSVKPKMASDSDKENESVTSKDGLDKAKGIDEHRDNSYEQKIPKVKQEESIPNPSIEIPADQARSLEHSPTESAIDGGKEDDESSQNEQFATFPTSNENPSPNLFVSESNIDENSGPLAINATQNADNVVEPGTEDDLSSNDETKGSATVSTPESLNKDVSQGSIDRTDGVQDKGSSQSLNKDVSQGSIDRTDGVQDKGSLQSINKDVSQGSIDKLDGDQTKGSSQTKSQDKAQVVETKSEDSHPEENVDGNLSATASDSNLNTESKTEANSTASDEIMDGEVPPSEIENNHNSMDDLTSKTTTFSPTAALEPKIQSTDGDAKPSSQDSDSNTNSMPAVKPAKLQDSESTVDGTTQPSSQDSDSNTDSMPAVKPEKLQDSESTVDGTTQTSSQDSDDKVANQANQESSGNSDEATSFPGEDAAAKSHSKQSDSTTDRNTQPKTHIVSTREELVGKPSPESGSTNEQLNSKETTQSDSTRDELAGEPSQESGSITDQLNSKATTQSDSTREEIAGEPSHESDSTTDQLNPKEKTQSGSTRDELAREPSQQSDSITDGEVQPPTSQSVNSTKPSSHGDDDITAGVTESSSHDTEALKGAPISTLGTNSTAGVTDIMGGATESSSHDTEALKGAPISTLEANNTAGVTDIMGGATESSSHDTEALKDAPMSTLEANNTAGATELATPSSGTYGDSKSSDLDDGKTGKGVEISQVRSNQDSKSYQDAPQSSPVSNSTLVAGDSGYSTSDYVATPELNHQSKSIAGNPSQSSDQSDDVVGGPLRQAPAYQTNTTLDGQEYDDTKGNVAQLSDVPVDEAFNPTGEHLNMEEDQNRVTYGAIKNPEEHQVNSFPSEIEDGEVLPPTGNTVLPKTEGFNNYNSNVPAIYN